MKRLLLFLALCALPAEAQVAGYPCAGTSTADKVMGREELTISNTGKVLTATVYAPAGGPIVKYAIFSLKTNGINTSSDGVAPTSTVGTDFTGPTKFAICGQINVQRFIAIRTGGSDATAEAVYYTAN